MSVITDAVLLAFSLSTDTFAASLSYGTNRIKIPWNSMLVICGICSGTLGLSMLFGDWISKVLTFSFANQICFILLFSLGILKLFDSSIKSFIRKHSQIYLKFTAANLNFILTVYTDAPKADIDNSKELSWREALWLASALSIDSIAIGFGAAFSDIPIVVPTIISFFVTLFAILLGHKIGEQIVNYTNVDLSWLSGALLIVLAFMKL